MGRRQQQMKAEGLARFLTYLLGHRPDEFGLVPDNEGFVSVKELLQAVHEEPEWRYVRESHLHEILLGPDRDLFQRQNDRIRSTDRRWDLDMDHVTPSLPRILYTPVRQRAHPAVMEKGLKGSKEKPLVLSADRDMALRIGRRRDPDPVVLEIRAAAAQQGGTRFLQFQGLYVAVDIPAGFIAGPPVPKAVLEARKEREAAMEKGAAPKPLPAPGAFILDPSRDPDRYRQFKGRKRKGWKEAARKMRRER